MRGCVGGAVCHFVVEQIFSGGFDEAMGWCACALVEAGYCLVVHARLCSVQGILPRSWCALMHDQVHTRVKDWIGFGSWSAVH